MSQWKRVDMQCLHCGHQEERTVDKREPDLEVHLDASDKLTVIEGNHGERCTQTITVDSMNGPFQDVCGAVMAPIMSAVYGTAIVRGNSDYSERQGKRLAQRSNDHFKREGRDEAIERQRQQWKKEGFLA